MKTKINIEDDEVTFVVLAEDVASPTVITYNIAIIDDDEDDDDDLFNLRVLNMHPYSAGIDVYMSESNETFNEAELVGEYTYTELSENQKKRNPVRTQRTLLPRGLLIVREASAVLGMAYPHKVIQGCNGRQFSVLTQCH